jgi:hypothetical protein
MFRRPALLAAVSVVAAAGIVAGLARADERDGPPVLVIGDSVATGMSWSNEAIAIVQRGFAVQWQVAICRRLTGESCPFDGAEPENTIDLVDAMTAVPPTVVVEMGYNDFAGSFAAGLDATIDALVARGAQRILWLTLREARGPYPQLNQMLAEALLRHPQLELVDWNELSAGHPEWFQNDGVHLTRLGGIAMAHLVHGSLTGVLDPLRIDPPELPPLERGEPVDVRLHADGGSPAYVWSLAGGTLPPGLHLLRSGRLYGTPTGRARPATVVVSVVDADGATTLGVVSAGYSPNSELSTT